MNQGWSCPACGGAHAPWVASCPGVQTHTISVPSVFKVDCQCIGNPNGELCDRTNCPRKPQTTTTLTISGVSVGKTGGQS